jgi:hypothetical protein
MNNQKQSNKVELVYLQTPTTLPAPFGFSSVTTLNNEKTPGLSFELGEHGVIIKKGDAMLLIPYANCKVIKLDRP